MRCLTCDADIPEHGRFCTACGAPIRIACTACRHPNPWQARYCAQCGNRLDGRPTGEVQTGHVLAGDAPPALQRRQLTVMFCDLAGSVALSTRLDPEDLRAVIGAYHRCCATVITQWGGSVASYMGDGVLAYFGYPLAHEADAERGVRAGLALLGALAELDAGGVRLQARIGLATGLVVAGDWLGAGPRKEQGAVGETPNLAQRLQALAEPGTLVIAESTRRLVGGLFVYRDLGRVQLKGFAGPIQAWHVLDEDPIASRLEARSSGRLTPLVGREEELALLCERWQRARDGAGQVVLLSGEAGIGKSRIAQALEQQLAEEPHHALRLFCLPHHQDSALHPNISQLEHEAGFARGDGPSERLSKLASLLARSGRPDDELPLFASLLSIPYGSTEIVDPAPSPVRQKERTLAALAARMTDPAASKPVFILYEDVHWMDATSLELLEQLIERIETRAVLLVITFRPDFAPPWVAFPHVTWRVLSRLGYAQGTELAQRVTGKHLPAEVLQQIVLKSDGVPLFVEELTKAVLESDLVRDQGDRYVLAGDTPTLTIPASLHDSLAARLDRLGPAGEIARIAAAIGRVFSYELLEAVAPVSAAELQDALRELVRAELVFRRGSPPSAVYRFKHALVRDVAYDSMLKSRRQKLNARIAQVLEAQFADEVARQPELLAHYYSEAGQLAQAIPCWQKAARRAAARAAHPEAVGHLRAGLALLARLPDDAARARLELELCQALATSLAAAHGYAAPEVEAAYARARDLCARIGNTAEVYPVLRGQCNFYLIRSDLRQALLLAEQCVEIGEQTGNADYLIEAYHALGYTLVTMGELPQGRTFLERSVLLYRRQKGLRSDSLGSPHDPACSALTELAVVAWMMNDEAAARRYCDEALSIAEGLGRAYDLAKTHDHVALFKDLAGEPAAAIRHAEQSIAITQEHGFGLYLIAAKRCRSISRGALGQAQDSVRELPELLAAWRKTGAEHHCSLFLMGLARCHLVEGTVPAGLAAIDEAIAHAEQYHERLYLPLLHLIRGRLLAASGSPARPAARAALQEAIRIARHQQALRIEHDAARDLAAFDAGADLRASATIPG